MIGRAQSTLKKSLGFLSTMPALLVLYFCGRPSCWVPRKSRAPRSFLAEEANLVCLRPAVQKKEVFMGTTFRKEAL